MAIHGKAGFQISNSLFQGLNPKISLLKGRFKSGDVLKKLFNHQKVSKDGEVLRLLEWCFPNSGCLLSPSLASPLSSL